MAPQQFFGWTFALLVISAVNFEHACATTTPKKRSINYPNPRAPPAGYWTSAPPPGLAAGRLLMDAGGLGGFSIPLGSQFVPQMTAAVVAPPPETPSPEPSSVTYVPLPAVLAALRRMTPAAINTAHVPTVCVHTHPVSAGLVNDLAPEELLVPGGAARAQTPQMLLSRLLSEASVMGTHAAATSGVQHSAAPDMSLVNQLLNRPGAPELPVPDTHLMAMAAAERSSVTERPALGKGNPNAEMFRRSPTSELASSNRSDQDHLSRLLSADGGGWSNLIRTSRRKRSTTPTSGPKTRQQLSATVSKIIRRVGFEKYGESLKVILQDLQPLKQSMQSAQNDLNKVQSAYQKFETDLNQLLEHARGAQLILVFILSSLLQENIALRLKLEECLASNQALTAELRAPRQSAEVDALRRQLKLKMRQYDSLVLGLLTKKSALEVERQQLRRSCNIRIKSGAEADPFSLSTFLSWMIPGLGARSGAQRDVNLLMMSLFPDLSPPPPRTARFTDPGAGSSWYRMLVPLMSTASAGQPVSAAVPPPVAVSFPFSRQLLGLGRPRTAPLTGKSARPPIRSTDSGDEFIMLMLQLMQLYSKQPNVVDDKNIKEQLVNFGRVLLC